jgi:hypothetical protein
MSYQNETRQKHTKQIFTITLIAGIGFSALFVLLFTKATHLTPCEILANYNINTQTCEFAETGTHTIDEHNNNSIYNYAAEVHGRGLATITQYALLIVEAAEHLI